jgi:hypothetical protein
MNSPLNPGGFRLRAVRFQSAISGVPSLSNWKADLFANRSWRPWQIHCSFVKRAFPDQQKYELATRIANDRTDKGVFDSAAAFQSGAMRFDYEIQSTTRALAGSLLSMNRGWSSRPSKLQKSPRAMTAALSAGGFQRRRAPCATGVFSIQGNPKWTATLGSPRNNMTTEDRLKLPLNRGVRNA